MKDIFNKRQRFSIRKFSVGVASVLIGVALFAPTQGVLASTENNLATEIGANSERENSTPTVEKKQESQSSPENRGALSSPAPKDTPIISTRTTELETSGEMGNNSLTTRASVAGEDRSNTPAVRAASNPSEIKKYELTEEDAKKIKAGVIGSEGNKLDSLLLNGSELSPEAYTDDDYLKDKDELYIYEKGGKKYVGYNSHPLLEDTDGDGIIDSKEKPDEKLKWNVSERDMIMFMELSYRDDNYIDRVLNHKKPLTESELYKKNDDSRPRYEYMMMNKELGPYWERKKSYHTSSGLDAVLYETKSDFSYLPNGTAQVLAFRGTSDAKDIGADITLGLGSNPQQGIDAENIMRELAKDKSITNLYLTGHSLGGYLVQRAMVEAYQLAYSDSRVMSSKEQRAYRNFYNNVLKKGTTFNAPKVRTSYFSSSEFWQKGLDSKKIAKSGKMTHYIVNNDSTIGKSVSNDSDVVINVGNTKGGHSSRSYFEADMINRRSEFMSGKRISLDGTGYQDKKIATVKSVEKVGETAVYSKRGDDIIKSTTVSIKDPDTGQITKNTLNEVFKKDGAKSTVAVTPLEPSVRYEKDATRAKGEAKITVAGIPGTRTVITTYTVNSTDGSLIPHEGPAVEVPSEPTVVKVPAKDEIEYLKEGDDVVKKTTTYTVNVSTGHLTPIEKKEIFKQNGAKAKVVVTPLQPSVRYEKDATRTKGGKNVTTAGTSGTRTVTTTYTVNPADGSLIPHEGKPVIKQSTPTVVKVPAKDEIEYLKEGDNVVKKTTTYAVNASTGALTPTVRKDVANPKGAKAKVVVTPIQPSVRYEKDSTKAKGGAKVTVSGTQGTRTVTTTYTVNPTDGRLIPHEGKPVIKSSIPTVVKVPAKDEVEYLKEGDDVVKKTTTYEVNASTGSLTPTEKQEVFKRNGAKSKVVTKIILVTTRYEADKTKDVGTNTVTNNGAEGKVVTTTPKLVNETNGTVTDGIPVVSRTEMVPKVVKVGAKDKVVETLIEPEVEYVKDVEKDFGTPDQRTEGEKGKTVTTTTYDVDPNDGHITEHVGTPVVTPAGKTIVKVGAKTKVERSKDPEGRDVIDTTTYEVDPKTGKVTPTTVRTYGTSKEPTTETRPVPSPVVYEKDDSRDKDSEPVRKEGTPGEDTITTTYTVDPNTGAITPTVGDSVRRKEPTNTIVKVPAKDKVVETPIEPEVEYVRDGEREVDTPNERVEGAKGKTVTTITYDVDSNDGHITEHVGTPVVSPAGKTIVKVGAKTKVEQSKDSEGRDVIDTTTYEVDPKTGKVTPTTVRTYGTIKEPTTETRLVPSPVIYEKDDTKEKGTAPTTVKGEDGEDTITTIYTVDPNTGKITASEGQPVRTKEPTNTIVKVAAKDKVETTELPSPKKYVKDDTLDKDQPNVEEAGQAGSRTTTTTYEVNPADGTITERVGEPVVVNPTATIVKVAAKDRVVEAPIEPEVEYVRDGEREVDTPNERVEGAKGKTVTTITYDVDSNDGHITEHVGTPVVSPAGKTIVKVGAKTKVEQSKDSEGRDVIDTTTYEVDPKTGKVTPTTVRTYGTIKEPTTETRPVPSPVVYEKDDTKEKGTAPTTVKGEDGEDTITTIYTVDPNTGKITASEGQAVRTKEPTNTIVKVAAKDKVETTELPSPKKYVKDDTLDKDQPNVEEAGQAGSRTTTTTYEVNPADGTITERVGEPVVVNPTETIVKVPAKDKVVETPIEPEVEYVRDGEREVDTPNERVEGAKGKTVTTTTYDVDSNDGHITEHVGNPVVTPAGKTIVKVGAKTRVEQSKDSEGRDVIDTTTYEVDSKTGKVTPTTVRTYGTIKEPTTETRLVPSPVIYEKDDTKEKGTAPTTVKGEDGEDTITTIYTVDPNTGKITASEGQPVRTKEPTNTIVKVAAKDKVETTELPSPKKYVKDDTRDKGQDNVEEAGQAGSSTTTTTYSVDSTTGAITERVGKPVVVNPTATIVKVAAKDKVETTELPSPKKYVKDDTLDKDQPNVEEAGQAGSRTTTTTYEVNPADGTITERVGEPVVVNPTATIVKVAAKDRVVEAPIEPEVEYVRDGEREVDTPNERVEGAKGKTVTTTTYDVDSNDGHITEHVGNPVVTPAGKTIVKVGAKTRVEQSKDSEGRDVIDTTTYEVDPKTGKITPTTVRTYGKTKEPTVELEQDSKTGDVTVTPKKPDGSTYPPGTKVEIPGKDGPITVEIGENGEGKVPNSDLPDVEKTGTGKITEPGKSSVEVPKVTTFENDVLSGSIALPELMIEVRWIDEAGNVLKPFVKTGSEKDAEHGSILGYEFVRTVIDENEPVITYIFRKVSGSTNLNTIPVTPVASDANGNSGHDTPAPTTPIPDAVTPNPNHEDTTDAIDNGAKSNDSQNVLPNTGTESNATLASLGLLGLLSGFGLVARKKKED